MKFLTPQWQIDNIKVFSTLRMGGFSSKPYDSFNLGLHCGDDVQKVIQNRNLLKEQLELPDDPLYLNQVHSNKVISLPLSEDESIDADGVYTNQKGQTCLIMTADCLPVILASQNGDEVCALHCGWRSLAGGIIEQGLSKFNCDNSYIYAYLAPCISEKSFEVGEDVYQSFLTYNQRFKIAFKNKGSNKYLCDLRLIAEMILEQNGVKNIDKTTACTYVEQERFFSYRRETTTGRMATLVWIEK